MKFKIFSTEIYVSLLFCAVLVIMLSFDRTGLAVYSLLSVFLHELSHLAAMKLSGCAPNEIRLTPAAVSITRSFHCSRKNELKIALAGSFGNLVIGLLFLALFFAFKVKDFSLFALINLITAAFNLLPVCGLDGGDVLNLILVKNGLNPLKAESTVRIITILFSAAALFFGVLIILRGDFNISAFIIGIYLLLCALLRY